MKKSPLKKVSDKRKAELQTGVKRVSPAKEVFALLSKGRKAINSRKQYYKDILFDSGWELQGYKELELRKLAGEIAGEIETHKVITFKLYNEAGDYKQFQINIDFEYFDKCLNRMVRKDRKSNKKLVKKRQPDWLIRWELLQLAEPDFQYELEYQN